VPGPDLSMGSTLARNATWFADTPAYVADGCTRSHAQLYARAARLRRVLVGRAAVERGHISQVHDPHSGLARGPG
jgi:hypothetical protein